MNLRQTLNMVLSQLSYEIHYYFFDTGDMMFHVSFLLSFFLYRKSRLYCPFQRKAQP